MDGPSRSGLRSFLIGGILGGVAGVLAAGRVDARRAQRSFPGPRELSPFEGAPCHAEWRERERARERAARP